MSAPMATQLGFMSAAALLALIPIPLVSMIGGLILVAFLPGFIIVRWIGLENDSPIAGRIVLGTAVSLVLGPVFLNPVWHVSNDRFVLLGFVWTANAAMIAINAVLVSRRHAPPPIDSRFFEFAQTRRAMAIIACITAGAAFFTYWPTEALGFPLPSAIHDYIKHHAVLASLDRSPLPLGNIFYAEGANEPVYYYHFFYLIPATLRIWSGHSLSFEAVFAVAGAMTALATVGIVYAITKRLTGGEAPATLAAALVTVIGGLDIIPLIPQMLHAGRPMVVLDAWADPAYRIHNVLNQMIWCPQNINGLLGVLVGVYILSRGTLARGWFILGPILGASIVGSSIWIAVGSLPALAAWALMRRRRLAATLVIGTLMVLICLPGLDGYLETSRRHGGSLTLDWPENTNTVFGHRLGPGILANFADAPLFLLIDLGAKVLLLPLVAVTFWKKIWRDEGLQWLVVSSILCLLLLNIVRTSSPYNILGQRTMLLPMVLGSILAGGCVTPVPSRPCWWNPAGWQPVTQSRGGIVLMAAVIGLGLPMGCWEAPLTTARRFYDAVHAEVGVTEQQKRLVDAERAACLFMRHKLPADAVVQPDPSPARATLAQVVRRQLGIISPQDDVMVFDPPDDAKYSATLAEVAKTLRSDPSAEHTRDVLRRHQITHVFLGMLEVHDWEHLDRFESSDLFETLFHQDRIRVVKLRGG